MLTVTTRGQLSLTQHRPPYPILFLSWDLISSVAFLKLLRPTFHSSVTEDLFLSYYNATVQRTPKTTSAFIPYVLSSSFSEATFSFTLQLYKGRINATSHLIQHPMYGAGHKYRTLHLPISTTLAEVLDRVSGMSPPEEMNEALGWGWGSLLILSCLFLQTTVFFCFF